MKKELTNKQSKFNIFGYDKWTIMQYFIIYSFVGFIIETIYGLFTKGVLESRQSMLYGPFCCIYGLGAIFLVCIPKDLKKNNIKLFISGFIIGSIVEYVMSWIGECIFHIKWWDYTNYPLNINGRICILFSTFWGILTILLNKSINPRVDKLLEKIPQKPLKVITIIFIVFLAIDFLVTSFALKMFSMRVINENNLEVQGVETYYELYLNMYENNEGLRNFVDKYFSNEKMLKTFPNIKFTLKDGRIILVKDILTDIVPYYVKVFE